MYSYWPDGQLVVYLYLCNCVVRLISALHFVRSHSYCANSLLMQDASLFQNALYLCPHPLLSVPIALVLDYTCVVGLYDLPHGTK